MLPDINFLTLVELNPENYRLLSLTAKSIIVILQEIYNCTVFSVVLIVIRVCFVGNINPNAIT